VKPVQLFLFIGVMTGLVSCKSIESPPSGNYLGSYHGFSKKPGINGALVYEGNLAKLRSYQDVYIEDVSVRGMVLEHHNRRIRRAAPNREEANMLAESFETALTQSFGEKLHLVDQPIPGSLTVRAAVVEMEPNSPLLFAAGYTPTSFAATSALWAVRGDFPGSGTVAVQAEIIDSETKERFYAMIDEDQTGKTEIVGGLSRWGRAKKAFWIWSRELSEIAANGR
tara:strand:+ start:10733 stop:11407 length:675 start_codon:yes stop_codon:yes gene_type:complete